jgi:hypothetical protein
MFLAVLTSITTFVTWRTRTPASYKCYQGAAEVLLHRLGEWSLFSMPVWADHETMAVRVRNPSQ